MTQTGVRTGTTRSPRPGAARAPAPPPRPPPRPGLDACACDPPAGRPAARAFARRTALARVRAAGRRPAPRSPCAGTSLAPRATVSPTRNHTGAPATTVPAAAAGRHPATPTAAPPAGHRWRGGGARWSMVDAGAGYRTLRDATSSPRRLLSILYTALLAARAPDSPLHGRTRTHRPRQGTQPDGGRKPGTGRIHKPPAPAGRFSPQQREAQPTQLRRRTRQEALRRRRDAATDGEEPIRVKRSVGAPDLRQSIQQENALSAEPY